MTLAVALISKAPIAFRWTFDVFINQIRRDNSHSCICRHQENGPDATLAAASIRFSSGEFVERFINLSRQAHRNSWALWNIFGNSVPTLVYTGLDVMA